MKKKWLKSKQTGTYTSKVTGVVKTGEWTYDSVANTEASTTVP